MLRSGKIIQYPPPIVPEFNFLYSGNFTNQLQVLKEVLSECLW